MIYAYFSFGILFVLLLISILYSTLPFFKKIRENFNYLSQLGITLTGSLAGVFLALFMTSVYENKIERDYASKLLRSYQIQLTEDISNVAFYYPVMLDIKPNVSEGTYKRMIWRSNILKDIELSKELLNNDLIMRNVSEEFIAMLVGYSRVGEKQCERYKQNDLEDDIQLQIVGLYLHGYYQVFRTLETEIKRLNGDLTSKEAKDLYYNHTAPENQKTVEEMCYEILANNTMYKIFDVPTKPNQ